MNRTSLLPLALIGSLAATLGACAIGAPPGFSDGKSWSFPLVGPLEDSLLIAPVFINDKGPYLMAIDPDAPNSAVDEGVVSEAQLYGSIGARQDDEQDQRHQMLQAEVLQVRLGSLTVRNRSFTVVKVGTFSSAGRQLRGILGRDVIADSLVFGFDRDRGVAYLSTQDGFVKPINAAPIPFEILSSQLAATGAGQLPWLPSGRRIAKVTVGAQSFKLHLDLGGVYSQLRAQLWRKAGLAAKSEKAVLTDEVGTQREIDQVGIASGVAAGAITAHDLRFAPFDDRRWETEDIDGTLGLNFFRDYAVWANWDKTTFFVQPRETADQTKDRLARWGAPQLSKCEHVGCVTIDFADGGTAISSKDNPAGGPGAQPNAAAPTAAPSNTPPGQRQLTVHRDASAIDLNLEVLAEAVDASGVSIHQPRIVINLPAGELSAASLVPSTIYGNAHFMVRDISPFPRSCGRAGGCIMMLGEGH